ncbi:SH3 domain-binding glutamic acid-rich protein homolog [Sitophilus oryzae]|uniref:SH3 domain-binding glutamic acid-rich protein homolog n=1 Tax=Sitophilus oryzae TaxID=7048 RepID=A0A6J2X9P9_SITOR|nr:SH3 domain-binding glutamic acid-rich protein homolog [Sitophilus oryzae]
MVVKVYVSGISGNKEVKKRQQKVLLILDSKKVEYEVLDIAEPNMEEAKEYMQNNSKLLGSTIGDPNPRHPLPPQIFNDDEYCGDFDAFDMANEIDEMEKFLKLSPNDTNTNGIQSNAEVKLENGDVSHQSASREASPAAEETAQATKDTENDPEVSENLVESTTEDLRKEETVKEKSPSQDAGDNETDDQKAENAANSSKQEAEEEYDETGKSDEE